MLLLESQKVEAHFQRYNTTNYKGTFGHNTVNNQIAKDV